MLTLPQLRPHQRPGPGLRRHTPIRHLEVTEVDDEERPGGVEQTSMGRRSDSSSSGCTVQSDGSTRRRFVPREDRPVRSSAPHRRTRRRPDGRSTCRLGGDVELHGSRVRREPHQGALGWRQLGVVRQHEPGSRSPRRHVRRIGHRSTADEVGPAVPGAPADLEQQVRALPIGRLPRSWGPWLTANKRPSGRKHSP